MENFYSAYNLPNFASIEEVKKHRNNLIKIAHPDTTVADKEFATAFTAKVNAIFKQIGNVENKALYDAKLNKYLEQPEILANKNRQLEENMKNQMALTNYIENEAARYKKNADDIKLAVGVGLTLFVVAALIHHNNND
ncbi:MAG: DnaJ domain [Bacteroidota bacterium]